MDGQRGTYRNHLTMVYDYFFLTYYLPLDLFHWSNFKEGTNDGFLSTLASSCIFKNLKKLGETLWYLKWPPDSIAYFNFKGSVYSLEIMTEHGSHPIATTSTKQLECAEDLGVQKVVYIL